MENRILTCIVCPRGCTLEISFDEHGGVKDVTGNACKRGVTYAVAECTHPERTVTSTVRTEDGSVVPVKTAGPIPKEKVFDAMKEINRVRANNCLHIGDIVIENVAETGVSVVVTANKEN